MASIIEKSDYAFGSQLKNFQAKITTYSVVLGVTANEITSVKADYVILDYVLTNQMTTQTFAQNYTAFKDLLRYGGESTLGPLPVMPAFGAAPATLPLPGIEQRFRKLVQRIKTSSGYTKTIGEDLGIEAPDAAAAKAAMKDGKPEFRIEMSSGGHPNLRWTKGKYEGVEIWKDAGSGFVKLDRDMRPDYIDKSDLPATGTAAVWRYKMIYLMDDEPIGNWSDAVSVTVHSEV